MSNNIVFNNEKSKTVRPDALDKAVALIFLSEALRKEAYEGCAALVAKARHSGARSKEISRVLAGNIRRVKGRDL